MSRLASIGLDTARALLQPRRLLPVAFLCTVLVIVQAKLSSHPRAAWVAVAMCLGTVTLAPTAWRILFADGARTGRAAAGLPFAGYLAVSAAAILIVGIALPRALGIGVSLMTMPFTLLACYALFMVSGWGLGRDIVLEARLGQAIERERAATREAERAQLLALRAHLDPHFLFNTLNAIAQWCREDGETAERAVLQLASMLRAVMAGVKAPAWPLRDEIELARALLELHRMRDPGRFAFEIRAPDPLPAIDVPPMLLLPLVENAVKHGPAAGHAGGVTVTIDARGDGGVDVSVTNPGRFRGARPGGEGLPMMQKRIALAYGSAARFAITGDDASGSTRATLSVPAAPILEVAV